MGQPAIVTEKLTKHYGGVRALVDVDLEVRHGEVFGFLGPNGAGKTTTIRLLLDLIRPTAGRASILGMDTRRESVEIRRRVGYLPGDLALYPQLTGRDTVSYFANLRGGVDRRYVDELAERLDADLDRKVGELSTGNRQKIGLIQAFMNRPEVLILDEPSIGLDPLVQRELQALIREAAGQGRTVFLSSHTLSEVQRVADRVGIIRKGRLVETESVSSLRSKAIRRVEFQMDGPVDPSVFAGVAGVRDVTTEDNRVVISQEGRMDELLKTAVEKFTVIDMTVHEADLEEIFLAYYREP
jgi:ABC-2 type transport system ATP-binding protein